jgi:hypothetical protein
MPRGETARRKGRGKILEGFLANRFGTNKGDFPTA